MERRSEKRHCSIAPVHPGEILREDVFPALRLTKPALAAALGISRQTLHDLFTLKRSVTPDMALRLEAVLGSSAETWLALQAERDLWEARKKNAIANLKRLKAA
jgi:addiction module HigA family antidote